MGHYVKFPDWSLEDTKDYQLGTQIYYEVPAPDGEHQPTGYGYTANQSIISEEYRNLPPAGNPAWTVHLYYAPLWDSSREYKKNDRVFHIISKKYDNEPLDLNIAYIYKATMRYNGGSKPPNEDTDGDGIRTWELETKPIPESQLPTNRPWLFPVKKKRGIFQEVDTVVGRDNKFATEIYHPEEGLDYSGWVDPPLNDEDGNPIDPVPRVPKQYDKWYTSVFEADPYNEDVYTLDGLEENPEYDPSKPFDTSNQFWSTFRLEKAMHWGEWTNRYGWLPSSLNWANIPSDEKQYWLLADRQFVYTRQYGYDPTYPAPPAWATYAYARGFSIEMWGSLASDEFELINAFIGQTPELSLPKIDAFASPVLVFGQQTDYEGNVISPATPAEFCKSLVQIYFNNPSFVNRTVTIFFSIYSTQYVWEKIYQYNIIYDEDGNMIDKTPILDGNGDWVFEWQYNPQPTTYRTVTQRYNTSDSAYKYDNQYVVRNLEDGINWSDLRIQDQVNSVGMKGFSYD
jgi:hypothetical protein